MKSLYLYKETMRRKQKMRIKAFEPVKLLFSLQPKKKKKKKRQQKIKTSPKPQIKQTKTRGEENCNTT